MRLALAAALAASTAAGETVLTLRDAVMRALEFHPLVAAGRERVAGAEGLRRQSALRPNPSFNFQGENIRFSGPPAFPYWNATDTFAFVSQTFETAGKRERRLEAATAGLTRAELELELLRRQIAARVKQAYWAAAGSRRALELLEETARNFQLTVRYHEVRVREGAMAEADLLRVRLESERIGLAAAAAALEADRARIGLFREMGQAGIPDSVSYEPIELDEAPPMIVDPESALRDRVEVRLARAAVEQAQATYRLQLATARPDLTGVLGFKRTEGLNTVLAGFQFDIPLRNRNQGNIAAAAAAVQAARAELAATENVVRAEVAAAARDYEIRRSQILGSLRPMMAEAAESAKIAQAAYREGGWDLLRLLDAERLRLETELLYIRALTEFRQSAAALEAALGLAP